MNLLMSAIRLAKPEDATDIVSLVNSAYRGQSSRQGWTTEADLLDGQRTDESAILGIIEDANSELLIYVNEMGRIQGCVQLERHGEKKAYLGMLTVQPLLQNSGLGKLMLNAAEDFVRTKWKLMTIEMTVISLRKELIEWYQRRGYALQNETRAFPCSNPRFGIPKRADLVFVVLKKNL